MIAGTHLVDGRELGLEHQFIERTLRIAEAATDRKGPGDVRGITFEFATGVDQDEITIP